MKNMIGILSLLALLGSVGCAHSHKVDGPQEKSEIPAGIRVSIGGKEVKEGDKLIVYSQNCHKVSRGTRGGGTRNECHDKEIGTAVVLKVLDHDSAIVAPQNGLIMDTTMKVEKQKGEQ